MKTLTVFTPTYNRKHTICRTFDSLMRQSSSDFVWLIIDDGSTDGTKEWVENLGEKVCSHGTCFDWMGRRILGEDDNHFIVSVNHPSLDNPLTIEYVYKPNGGLYTGYNVAYSIANTELCVCIDSDDYMPEDAIKNIVKIWNDNSVIKSRLGGIVGLDYNVVDKLPIGGPFKISDKTAFFQDLHHNGDTKQVMRTDLMRKVAPQIGFEGEKDFNPYYMLMQVCDKYPLVVMNENFCWVEYQTTGDSMSAGIWRQYIRSPQSYAKYRIMQLKMHHGTNVIDKIRLTIHYISSCILSHDEKIIQNVPYKALTILLWPMGWMLSIIIRRNNSR